MLEAVEGNIHQRLCALLDEAVAAGDLALDQRHERFFVDRTVAEGCHQRRHDALEQNF